MLRVNLLLKKGTLVLLYVTLIKIFAQGAEMQNSNDNIFLPFFVRPKNWIFLYCDSIRIPTFREFKGLFKTVLNFNFGTAV